MNAVNSQWYRISLAHFIAANRDDIALPIDDTARCPTALDKSPVQNDFHSLF
jgi:hypothetical protein